MTPPNTRYMQISQRDAYNTGSIAGFCFEICNLVNAPIVFSVNDMVQTIHKPILYPKTHS